MTSAPSNRWLRPGRLIALAAVVVLLLAAAASFVRISRAAQVPIGSNGVGIGAVITSFTTSGDTLCLDAVAPKGTGAVQLWLGYHDKKHPVSLSGAMKLAGGTSLAIAPQAIPTGDSGTYITFPLSGVVAKDSRAQLCVTRAGRGGNLDVAGATVYRRAGEHPATMAGKSLEGTEPALHFLAAGNPSVGGLHRIGPVFQRLSALSPSGFSPVLLAVLLLTVVPASLFLLLWNLATAPRRSARRVGLLCVVASLGITASWATLTPTFQGPDETEHFAYAQHLAFTGHRADPSRLSTRPGYSTQEVAVMSLLRNNAVIIDRAARQPWTKLTRLDVNSTSALSRTDGGGFTDSASGHSALYYALVSPAIHLGGKSLTSELYLARLETAIMAAMIAGLAVWAAAIVVPGRRRVGALAGIAAATLPIAGSIGGVLNNDTLVNLVAAAAFVAVLAVLKNPRGPLWRFALLGALVLVLPIAKISGIGMMVAFGGALIVAATLRRQPLLIVKALLAGAAGFVAAGAVLAGASELLVTGQTLTLYNNHPIIPTVGGYPVPFINKFDYPLQLFFPFIHLNIDLYPPPVPLYRIYVMGSWGGFGWNRFYLPTSVNLLLGGATAVAILAGWSAIVRERVRFSKQKLVGVAIAFTPIIALAFVAEAYVGPGPRDQPPEQGRYILIALVAVSLWFAAVPAVVKPGRVRSLLTGAIAGGLCAMAIVGLLEAAVGFAA